MKKNRLYSLSVLVIGVLISVSLLPLRIYAQSLTSPFLGINFQVTAYGENASSITLPKINIEYIGSTVPSGYISGQLNCTTPSSPSSSTPCDVFQFQNTSGQSGTGNGTRIYLNLQNYLLEANGNATINHQSYFFIDYEFILDDNYKGYVTITDEDNNTKTIYVNGNEFHYQRMQLDTTEKSITIDDYSLTRVTDAVMWNFPIESFSFISNFLDPNGYYKLVDYPVLGKWTYPMFKLPSGSNIEIGNMPVYPEAYENETRTKSAYFIFVTNASTTSQINNMVGYSGGPNLYKLTRMYQFRLPNPDTNTYTVWAMWKYEFRTETPQQNITLTVKNTPFYIIPIYKGYGLYLSSDFAEENGFINYYESSSNLNQTNDQFTSDSNDLITIEDTFNNSMNNALQNVSPTFNMGQSFLNSANWVSTQFNRIVNNTPFASLITFGLTLGLGLLIIGKVRK